MSLRLTLLLLPALILAACSSPTPPAAGSGDGAAPPAGGGGEIQLPRPALKGADQAPSPADAMAYKTAAYLQTIETALARRPTSQPTTDASGQWTDPTAPRGGDPRPPVKPWPTDSPDGANQSASLPTIKNPADVRPPTPVAPMRTGPVLASDELERKLYRQIKDQPRDLVAQVDYQLLQLVRDEPVPQLAMVSGLANEDRELLSTLLDSLANFRNALRAEGNMLPNRKIRPLMEMADRLRSQADLRINTVALCTRVDGFGNYEPIEPLRFAAGRDHPAILYCEIENFASQLNDRRMWETRVTQEVVLYDETGMAVWREKARATTITDLSRNRRHDFYLVKKIALPATLPVNRYMLKVTVVDQQANRVSETTLPIQVVAQ